MRQHLCLSVVAMALIGTAAQAANPVVVMETSMGTIKIELNEEKAPITVKNFLRYVDDKHYDGTVFHRVIADFMIQGGGFKQGVSQAKSDEDMERLEKVTRDGIKNESANGLSNLKGTIAMARTQVPDSATAQFFINTKDNSRLDGSQTRPGYAVFGKVIEGMDVVEKIRNTKTKTLTRSFDDVPVEDVLIKSVRRAE